MKQSTLFKKVSDKDVLAISGGMFKGWGPIMPNPTLIKGAQKLAQNVGNLIDYMSIPPNPNPFDCDCECRDKPPANLPYSIGRTTSWGCDKYCNSFFSVMKSCR